MQMTEVGSLTEALTIWEAITVVDEAGWGCQVSSPAERMAGVRLYRFGPHIPIEVVSARRDGHLVLFVSDGASVASLVAPTVWRAGRVDR